MTTTGTQAGRRARWRRGRAFLALVVGAALAVPAIQAPAPRPAAATIPDCDAEPPPTDPICGTTTTTAAPPPPGPIAREVVHHETDPTARPAASAYLDEVLDRARPANRAALAGRTARLHVIPSDRMLTEYAPWAVHRGETTVDENPGDGYDERMPWDEVRGIASCDPLEAAVGEELLTRVPSSPYARPTDGNLGRTLFHEAGHLVHCSLSPQQRDRLATLHAAARARPLDTVVGQRPTYSRVDPGEYFAEATVAWFGAGEHPSYSRTWLQANDPGLLDLLATAYEAPPAVPRCLGIRATAVLRPPGTFAGAPGRDVVAGSSGRDVVSGGGGDDLVCGAGGADEVHGGDGNDEADGGPGDDLLHGDAGNDAVQGGTDADTLHGDAGNDRLFGGPGGDLLHGDAGADDLYGGDGDDRYFGGDGDDDLSEDVFGSGGIELGLGDDHMDGGAGDDTMSASVGDDTFLDARGDDQMVGGDGNDEMYAVDLTDPRLPPATPPDHLDGQAGLNTCTADPVDVINRCLGPGES